jgi:hypothetical protein
MPGKFVGRPVRLRKIEVWFLYVEKLSFTVGSCSRNVNIMYSEQVYYVSH